MKTNTILWTPNHAITENQMTELKNLGYDKVIKLSELAPELAGTLSNTSDDVEELEAIVNRLDEHCRDTGAAVLPVGSPAFMFLFSKKRAWWDMDGIGDNYKVFFAHSERESKDQPQPDGSVKKISVFKHVRFFEV